MTKLLVVDDELAIRKFLVAAVDPKLYELVLAEDGATGIRLAATESPDLILLDLGLPDIDGVDVTTRIREWSAVPIIILSARDDDMDKVKALDAGANDYLTKPFSVPELFARIRVALRGATPAPATAPIRVFDVTIDIAAHTVHKSGKEVHLTKTEFKFLTLLAKNLGRVLTHSQILREVWGPEYLEELHYLRVYSQQIRAKLEDDPAQPKILITETGIGYRLRSE
ncbi:MAG TPA: response regulator [Fimbriimonas sp.]|nr:response regulator [Fimbriimonas sp.]